ncbi:lariat debranching enzyme [Histoplasma capsulatum G186AR]|uniref:Lariat debranching enzyme n=1 Tax=Ajellomyces capsulatus TaxID=5037 RepID=A0A8H7ZBT6_AJECA|nr:lariat debranching enzyme [Histoplasma capsulatum]QSS76389.1 lariat debranching enzyme [Histoplasma capsulatum G186AR]
MLQKSDIMPSKNFGKLPNKRQEAEEPRLKIPTRLILVLIAHPTLRRNLSKRIPQALSLEIRIKWKLNIVFHQGKRKKPLQLQWMQLKLHNQGISLRKFEINYQQVSGNPKQF